MWSTTFVKLIAVLTLLLSTCRTAARADSVNWYGPIVNGTQPLVAPYSGLLYATAIGGSTAATVEFGRGTNAGDLVPLLNGLPHTNLGMEVFVGTYAAGEELGIYLKNLNGETAFSNKIGLDSRTNISYLDSNNSLGFGNQSIFLQLAPNIWTASFDDPSSWNFDDDDNDVIMSFRLAPVPEPVGFTLAAIAFFAFGLVCRSRYWIARMPEMTGRRRSTFGATVGILSCLTLILFSCQAKATVIPPNLPPGSQYQLIFVTESIRDATSSNIDDYNAFVTSEAALSPSLPATLWHAVASTTTVNAIDNAPSVGLPVYNTHGDLVASAATGLYTATLLNPIIYTQHGIGTVPISVWTGSDYTGLVSVNPMGAAGVQWGNAHSTTSTWASQVGEPAISLLPLYALSDPITAVPEPSAVVLLGSATVVIVVLRLSRKRCRKILATKAHRTWAIVPFACFVCIGSIPATTARHSSLRRSAFWSAAIRFLGISWKTALISLCIAAEAIAQSGGAYPQSVLAVSGSAIYGTTNTTVFKIDTDGTGFSTLHEFTGGPNDGSLPRGVALSGTWLYGTTQDVGGVDGAGKLFRIDSDGSDFEILHSFGNPADGQNPTALTFSGDQFFGATSIGGANGHGAVFRSSVIDSEVVTLYSFDAQSKGAGPGAPLALSDSTLYGTTQFDGMFGQGTLFKVSADGSGYSLLHTFGGANDSARGPVTVAGSTIYGASSSSAGGFLYEIGTDGSGFEILHSFSGSDGATPVGGLILAGSTLYGTTVKGGAAGLGSIFRVNIDGTGFDLLHSFTGGPTDGRGPQAGLTLVGETLFGTTFYGGLRDEGTIFSIAIDGSDYRLLHSFAIPEPSSIVLAALGVIGLAVLGCKRILTC